MGGRARRRTWSPSNKRVDWERICRKGCRNPWSRHLTPFLRFGPDGSKIVPNLSHWDLYQTCPTGMGKVKRDLSLSHGQVIYPRWRPVLVAGPWQALCPRWNLSQSNLSHPVPQSRTTRPWKVLARAHCPSHIISDQVEMEKLTRINNKTSTEWSCAEDQILGNKNLRNRILNICTERYVKYFFEIYLPVREHTWLIGSGGLEKDGYWLMLLLLLRKK